MIGDHIVYRILVDNGSLIDILYSDCLTKMRVLKEQMEKTTQPLYGFTRDLVIPQGMIKLPIIVGEKPRQAIVMANFTVINGAWQYNVVIGRPTLRALKAITSIYHQKIKFLTSNDI